MKTATFLMAAAASTAWASTNSTLDAIVNSSNANIMAILESRVSDPSATCTSENVSVRKEWAALTSTEKIEYIAAVKCMMNTTAITPASAAPGARSRFDDFGALHVNQTSSIHWTASFHIWHRYYVHLYEKALVDECGYTGTQPYWDWSSTSTLAAHPLFDGSDTSIGGNGASIENRITYVLIPRPEVVNTTVTAGTGGGCIEAGPFANHTAHLGPHGAPITDGLAYNPRCLTRDFRDWALPVDLHYDNVTAVMLTEDIASFTAEIDKGNGLHFTGHTVTGGFQDDLWTSAQDPSFVFHHAQMDRVLTLWQGVNQTVRTQEISGTITIQNDPPSRNGTLDDVIDTGFVGESLPFRDLMSTIDGPFCYIYA